MLVIDDSPYGARVPVQIGSLHIDMAIDLATEAEMKKLSCKWERARMAHLLRMGSMSIDEKFDKSEFIFGRDSGNCPFDPKCSFGTV